MVYDRKIVLTCYDILDGGVSGNLTDFTEGIYEDNDTDYNLAQENQANWLLDSVNCHDGSVILDIGCGYGRILETANDRKAISKGITLSPIQAIRNRNRSLDVDVLDYRNIDNSWNGLFTGIISNGSLEHYVQVTDAINGKQESIYREFFSICHKLLIKKGKLVTTSIHFANKQDPNEINKDSSNLKRGSTEYHFAKILKENFGGWYPFNDQLQHSAREYFKLESRTDGTEDYHKTSEEWLNIIKRNLYFSPKSWFAFVNKFYEHPRATIGMLDTWVFSQSWMWQFRKDKSGNTPTKLYRDIWKRID